VCVHCSYPLDGLRPSGACPECGRPVEDSIKGFLLRWASPEYLWELKSGLSLYLNGILVMIVVFMLNIAAEAAAPGDRIIGAVMTGLGLIPSVMMILGFWRYTAPDPGYVGQESPSSARQIARIGLIVSAAVTAVSTVLEFLGHAGQPFPITGGAAITPVMFVGLAFGLIALAAWAAQFFAGLQYTAWVMGRIPDPSMVKICKRYMWLLPLIFVLGFACIGLGPILALVLFWNHLDKLRKHLKTLNIQPPVHAAALPR
jgi:hypothetical protein